MAKTDRPIGVQRVVGMDMMQTDGSLNGSLVERNESASIVNLPTLDSAATAAATVAKQKQAELSKREIGRVRRGRMG